MLIRSAMKTAAFALILSISVFGYDGVTKRIKFAKGRSSTTISYSVIRGEVDTYILGAEAAGIDKVTDAGGNDTISTAISRSLGFADYSEIENILAAATTAAGQTLTGSNGVNRLSGHYATTSQTLVGLNNDDIYTVGFGDKITETLTGGTLDIANFLGTVGQTYTLNAGSYVERLVVGGTLSMHIAGNELANSLF